LAAIARQINCGQHSTAARFVGSGQPWNRSARFRRWTFVVGKNRKILYKNTGVHPLNDRSTSFAIRAQAVTFTQ
jgi:hypothetical protein